MSTRSPEAFRAGALEAIPSVHRLPSPTQPEPPTQTKIVHALTPRVSSAAWSLWPGERNKIAPGHLEQPSSPHGLLGLKVATISAEPTCGALILDLTGVWWLDPPPPNPLDPPEVVPSRGSFMYDVKMLIQLLSPTASFSR